MSQEFQLLGKALDNRLNYVAGLYYFKEAGYVHDYVPFESLLYVYDVANDVQNEDYAAFIHADFNLTDRFGFTAGGRYTHVKADFLGGQSDLNSFPLGSTLYPLITGQPYLRYFPPVPDSQSWDIFTPTAGFQFHFNSDVMAYLSWSKGFKAGGWTTRLSAVIPDPKVAEYKPEYSKTWELGLKSEWFNHHLLANTAVYYTDYTGIQLNIQQGISPVYTNAGDAKIKGAELELQWLVGGGLQINAAADYIDAYYTFVNPNANIPQYANPDGSTVCPAGPPICAHTWAGVSATGRQAAEDAQVQVLDLPAVGLRALSNAPSCASSRSSPTPRRCSTTRSTPRSCGGRRRASWMLRSTTCHRARCTTSRSAART